MNGMNGMGEKLAFVMKRQTYGVGYILPTVAKKHRVGCSQVSSLVSNVV